MTQYIMKLVIFLLVSVWVIWGYYERKIHLESAAWSWWYIIFLIALYFAYKIYSLSKNKSKVSFTPFGLFWLAMINIFALCVAFFSTWSNWSGSWMLFLSIIWYMFLPFLVTLFLYSAWRKALSNLKSFESQTKGFKFLASLWLWFVMFFSLLSISAFIYAYNIYDVWAILFIFLAFAYDEIFKSIIALSKPIAEFDNHRSWDNVFDAVNFKLISAEITFIFLTFLIWVNFINVVRPMPIWWDDLGAYMNFPQIMANSQSTVPWNWMYAWMFLTWIWFMFHSAPQAFFFNQLWWILSIIVLIVTINEFLSDWKKRFLSLPIIIATMFYSMPMVIFQQAKDMKLDPGLFFVSVIGIYWIYALFTRYLGYEETKINYIEEIKENPKNWALLFFSKLKSVFKMDSWETDLFENKDYLIYLFVFASVIGLAFTIKFTTLMLILWTTGVIFYAKLGFNWFLWYFALFVWIFTRFRLWDQLNVSYPKNDPSALNTFSYICVLVSIIFFGISIERLGKLNFIKTMKLLTIFIIGIALPIIPWMAKNLSDSKGSWINTNTLLFWKFTWFEADYTKIYTKKQIEDIETKAKKDSISSEWKASNEDLWRYFWYDEWINNYLKLPYNLTYQTNQSWEYTEITYFFLALLPISLIFLAFTYEFSFLWIAAVVLFWILYYSDSQAWKSISDFFWSQKLPFWYIYLVLISLGSLAYFIYTLSKDKLSQLSRLNFVFMSIYVLVFVISAFWIVWYWIAMYFSFLLAIAIGWAYISEQSWWEDENVMRLFWSVIFFLVISFYFVWSSFPHWYNNLNSAWFPEFKAWILNQESAIFASHPDYFKILWSLNLKDEKAYAKDVYSKITDPVIKRLSEINFGNDIDLYKLESLLKELTRTDLSKYQIDAQTANNTKLTANELLSEIYKTVLYPPKSLQNNNKIYRIWTFLTYFISENRNRFYDDSLVMSFDKYFYDKDPNVSIERMKKLWLSYLLVDLNAATIDKDPRHDLTSRYERLLSSFKSDKLELIQTDSICLRLALEEKKDNYLDIAWVNYESYTSSWQMVWRNVKQLGCYNHILELLKSWKIDNTHYSYLIPLANYLNEKKINDQAQLVQVFQQFVNHWWLALFKIK